MFKFILAFTLLLSTVFINGTHSQSREPVTLTDGLLIKLKWPAVRNVITPDGIIASMYNGSWKTPAENAPLMSGGKKVGIWRKISAGADGWIRNDSLRNSYVYYTYESGKDDIVLLEANGNEAVYVNGEARSGNPYGYKDKYESWAPRFDYSFIPIKVHKGTNTFLFHCNRGILKARIHPERQGLIFNTKDLTIPDLSVNQTTNTYGAIPVINAMEKHYEGLFVKTFTAGTEPQYYPVKGINPLSIQKVRFAIRLPAYDKTDSVKLTLQLVNKNGTKEDVLSATEIGLRVLAAGETYRETFISALDSSVQYYAVNPPQNLQGQPALFLSLHGAGVEGLNQAQAYNHKNWGYIVAPTNRRPYGYNWENWGRLDALEVLNIVKKEFNINKDRVYLTGHSMGGHGTWQLGINYADQFACIGPSAGWISIWSYRIGPQPADNTVEKMLLRSNKQSDTYTFTTNLKPIGVYIIQGDEDDNVPPEQAESIVANLSKFHKDYIYHVQHGVGHWWDISDEPGADCVDWRPMFDFFAHHAVAQKEQVKTIDFVTANLAVASKNYWIEILNQVEQQHLSRINISLEQGNRKFTGTTENVKKFSVDVSMLSSEKPVTFVVDSQTIAGINIPPDKKIYLARENGNWQITTKPDWKDKNPARCGNIREVLNHGVIFVYGTHGSKEENIWAFKEARYQAERIWYRGNGAIEVITDKAFDLNKYKDRSVFLFGNSKTNAAWDLLLASSPVQVGPEKIKVGKEEYTGDDYACLMVRPRKDSKLAMVCAISGTGVKGMKLASLARYYNQYVGFPDVVIYNSDILQSDEKGVKFTGYFGNDWGIETGEFVSH